MKHWVWAAGLLLVLIGCSLLPEQCDDSCLLETALAENNPLLCEQISREHWVTWCYTDIAANTNDTSVCEYLSGNFKNNCIRNIALATQEVSLCEEIQGSVPGDACYNSFARETLNFELCALIEGTNMHNDCVRDLALVIKNYELCFTIRDNPSLMDNCLFRATLVQKTTDGCEYIQAEPLKNACYITYAANNKDLGACEDVDESQRAACEQAVNRQ